MLREPWVVAIAVALTVVAPRVGEGAQRCTNSKISELERQVEEIADAEKRTAATIRLAMSKVAMENGDPRGCAHHIEAAREAMGD